MSMKMSMSLEALTTLCPDQIWLEVSPDEIENKWSSQHKYSYDVARWNAFLNNLTLDAFLKWIEEESGIKEQLKVWPSREDLPRIWEVVNGTVIKLGETRIVLIPSGDTDTKEFCVPAEWVDIPSWAADYYLAVQVNPDGHWLRVWGYTTHKKLKQVGEYNNIRRTYSLEGEELIEDLNVMWVARELGSDRKAAVEPLPNLSRTQKENLLKQLSQPSSYSPRLKIDFAQWAVFIEDETFRQQLYKQRIEQEPVAPVVAVATRRVNLRQWLQRNFEEGWQAVEDVLVPAELIPTWGPENPQPHQETDSKAISSIIPLLQPHQDELVRRQAAGVLGEIGVGDRDVSEALTELLHTARDEKTRWQAAISLGKVDPGNSEAGCRRARLIDLGMELGGHPLALIVTLMPKADGKLNVWLQVQSTSSQTHLPPGLKLVLLSESDETVKEVEARSYATGQGKDDRIQLAFSCSPGTHFRVKVTFNNVSFTKSFDT